MPLDPVTCASLVLSIYISLGLRNRDSEVFARDRAERGLDHEGVTKGSRRPHLRFTKGILLKSRVFLPMGLLREAQIRARAP